MPASRRQFRNIPTNRRMAKRAKFNAMALLAVMIMWLAERGPPSIVLLQQSKGT
jgi:hypothetical protein